MTRGPFDRFQEIPRNLEGAETNCRIYSSRTYSKDYHWGGLGGIEGPWPEVFFWEVTGIDTGKRASSDASQLADLGIVALCRLVAINPADSVEARFWIALG